MVFFQLQHIVFWDPVPPHTATKTKCRTLVRCVSVLISPNSLPSIGENSGKWRHISSSPRQYWMSVCMKWIITISELIWSATITALWYLKSNHLWEIKALTGVALAYRSLWRFIALNELRSCGKFVPSLIPILSSGLRLSHPTIPYSACFTQPYLYRTSI